MQKNREENKALIAERVKSARSMARLKQSDVAKKLGLTPQAISNYERGVNSIPNSVIQQMAALYRTSTDYLLGTADSWAYFDDAAMGILGDDVADVPARYAECVNHLCTAIKLAVSIVAKESPDLLPYADQCLYAAIDSFIGLSDLFFDTPAKDFDLEQYQKKGVAEINKMTIPFYEFLILTRDTHKQVLDKPIPKDD